MGSFTIGEQVAEYEEDHAFARKVMLPEEDRRLLSSLPWLGGYRWFRPPNVVCLEKYRQLKNVNPQGGRP